MDLSVYFNVKFSDRNSQPEEITMAVIKRMHISRERHVDLDIDLETRK